MSRLVKQLRLLKRRVKGFSTSPLNDALLGLTRRVERRQATGQSLDPVESYYIEQTGKLLNNNFGPSRLSAYAQVVATTLPVALVILAGTVLCKRYLEPSIDFFDRGFYTASADASIAYEEVESEDVALESAIKKEIETVALSAESNERKLSSSGRNELEVLSLTKFLSGFIASYKPSINDCGLIAKHIVRESADADVSPFYIAAMISVESSFLTHARSHVGAQGLMQLLPNTAKEVFNRTLGQKDSPKLSDPALNIRLGITYIKQLERRYRGNRIYALAAYNWGLSNVDAVIRGKKRMPSSVRNYATKILERTNRWQKHYRMADDSTKDLKKFLEVASNATSPTV